ncbi:MAG: hypothetical protein IJC49_02770 [Clostridia bacterium]|nr:hypothetical protein [Clostridia bacterium]
MRKYLCLLMALLMVVACFAACGGDNGGDTSKNESKVESGNETSKEEPNNSESDVVYHDMLPEATDMGGREFNILQRWFGYGKETIDFQGEVIWDQTDEDGTMSNINLAKRQVLEAVQKDYNCTIVGEMSTDTAGNIRTFIQEDILSGAPTIDFCFETYYYYYSFIENGYLVDLKTLGIDFEKAWWDQDAVKDLSVSGKLYYALGDINTYDNDGTFALLFNKSLYESKGGDVQALYQLAKDGDWTFEKFSELIKGFGSDNGDSNRDELDTYGLLTETSNLYLHVLAAGEKTIDKDANDQPIFALDTERVYNANNDAVDLYTNTNDVLVADLEVYKTKFEGQDVYGQTVTKAFKEGRGLFYMTGLIHLPYFRDMEDDFGILPIPKYDDTQDRYYHTMSPHTASCVFVPTTMLSTGEKGKQIGTLLDALGAYSKDYLTPEYYEKQLKRGDASDPDSAAMLDVIFTSRTFDLGAVFAAAWSDPTTMCQHLDKNLKSRIDSNKDVIEIAIEDSMAKINEAND